MRPRLDTDWLAVKAGPDFKVAGLTRCRPRNAFRIEHEDEDEKIHAKGIDLLGESDYWPVSSSGCLHTPGGGKFSRKKISMAPSWYTR
jgi:hypothetical protein